MDRPSGSGNPRPRLSVVVPTYRRPDALARCLAALAEHDLGDQDVEVVVVDDGSPAAEGEGVAASVRNASSRLSVRLHRQANTGPAGARNAGAEQATADFVAFTDDDCMPTPDWPGCLLRHLDVASDALVGGRTVNALPGNLYAQASQDLLSALYRAAADHPQVAFFASNNIGMSRSLLLDLGGFDRGFPGAAAEDRDFSERWRAAGRPLRYAEDAVVTHAHEMRLAGFWRQHVGYGRGAHQLASARAVRGAAPPRLEGPGFYLRLLAEPFRTSRGPRAVALTGLIGLSQVATAAGYLAERRRRR